MNAAALLTDKLLAISFSWDEDKLIVKRGEVLEEAGTVSTAIYFVAEGALRICYNDGNGEHIIRFGYPGSLFTRLDSFLTGRASAYSIVAVKRTQLLRMPASAFREFIASAPEHLTWWNDVLSLTVASLLERETDLLTASPKERYERVLRRSPQLFQHIPHRHIANYLRMAPETLSRLKKS